MFDGLWTAEAVAREQCSKAFVFMLESDSKKALSHNVVVSIYDYMKVNWVSRLYSVAIYYIFIVGAVVNFPDQMVTLGHATAKSTGNC